VRADGRDAADDGRGLRADDGVAAVEFGLLIGVVMLLVALVWPLGDAFMQKMRLERATTDVIRYATATPNTPAYDPAGGAVSRRPTCAQVEREFYRAYGGAASSTDGVTISIPVCPNNLAPGQTVTVQITKTANLGPFGTLLDAAGITHSSSITVSAAASGREE
jgi:Flp pilus assembly protein TadG